MPRQNHFLNFQDPDGNPKDNPLIVNGFVFVFYMFRVLFKINI